MNMKNFATLLVLSILIHSNGQTGPGGIGNATSNGLWLKAGDINVSNGTDVTNWPDASGNSNDAFQTDILESPNFFSTSSINGQPVIRLDGIGDELEVADANILDGTSGITFYAIVRPTNMDGAARGILGKRVTFTVNTEYAYTWFFFSGNQLFNDIHTQNNRYSSGGSTFSNSTNYLLSFDFNGALPAAQRSRMFSGNTKIAQNSETSTALPNSNQPLAIGALNVEYGTYFEGDMAEIIHFNYSLDSVEHIIVSNYLSAKYNISLNVNDIYKQDDPLNGNYDHQVFGIGQLDKDQFVTQAQGDGIVRVSNPSDLGDDEYFFAGHDDDLLGTWGSTDFPSAMEGRWHRTWRVTESSVNGTPVDVGSLDMDFDLTGIAPLIPAHIGLLIDTDNDGLFIDETPIIGATNIGGGFYRFSGVSELTDGLRFTLGTFNIDASPLPIELISFEAIANEDVVDLYWSTASELNNDYFRIEKTIDGENWSEVLVKNGAGNSSSTIDYFDKDIHPYSGKSYYRLVQVDFNGSETIHNVIPVNFHSQNNYSLNVYPNPTTYDNINISLEGFENQKVIVVLRDTQGREFYSKIQIIAEKSHIEVIALTGDIPKGIYLITASSNHKLYSKKLIIK